MTENESNPERRDDGTLKPGHSVGAETRFQKGQSGNPKGRPAAGLSVIEYMNVMQRYTRPMLVEIALDNDAPVSMRSAANRWLQATRPPTDLADFDDYLEGRTQDLKSLKAQGVDTSQIRKTKVRTNSATGVRTVEMELREPDLKALDLILDRIHGRPTQTVKPTRSGGMSLVEKQAALKRLLNPAGSNAGEAD